MSNHKEHYHSQSESDQLAVVTSGPKKPTMYQVFILNDDYTPMDFVVELLKLFFRMNQTKATQLMMNIHLTGKGICGIFSRDLAETKAHDVNKYARKNKHPLLSKVEPIE